MKWRQPWLIPAAGVLLFFLIRLTAALCAGDTLVQMGDQEAKHTEMAWALAQGDLGTTGWRIRDFLLTGGNVHHGGFLSISMWFWALSKVFGESLLTLRMIPILWWTGTVAVWAFVLHRRVGPVAAGLSPIAFLLAPVDVLGWQLHTNGSHTEIVLPLALMCAGFCLYLDAERRTPLLAGAAGLAVGYAVGFNLAMGPVVLLLLLIGVLPPAWWRAPKRLGVAVAGVLVGLWPLWLLMALDFRGFLFRPLTEDPSSQLGNVARGLGNDKTIPWLFFDALEIEWQQGAILAPGGQLLTVDGGFHLYRTALILGALLLVPAAIRSPGPARRLGLLVGMLPAAMLLIVSWATPFDMVRPVYVLAPLSVGLVWPALAVGLGLGLWSRPAWFDRVLGAATGGVGVLVMLFVLSVSVSSIPELWQPDRAGALLRHRYSAYWHYRMGPIPAEQVDRWNDVIDVREQDGDPMGMFGFPMTVLAQEGEGVPDDGWLLDHWAEVSGNFERAFPLTYASVDLGLAAENIGWGLGIRSGFVVQDFVRLVGSAQRDGRIPPELDLQRIWTGWGYGRARAELVDVARGRTVEPAAEALVLVPEEFRAAASRGMDAAHALGPVPRQRRPTTLRSVLGGPT